MKQHDKLRQIISHQKQSPKRNLDAENMKDDVT